MLRRSRSALRRIFSFGDKTENGDSFQTMMAVMIALLTLTGALIAWRASLASGKAGSEDMAGIYATLNAEQLLTLNHITLFRHLRAYTDYRRYSELNRLLQYDSQFADAPELAPQQRNAEAQAGASRMFFPTHYIARDGSYDSERALGEAWAEVSQNYDLEPQPHFDLARLARRRALWLTFIFVPLSIALCSYTLAESIHAQRPRLRRNLAMAGTLFFFATAASVLLIERSG